MTRTQKQRLIVVSCIIAGVALASWFGLKAFQANIEYFLTPEQINNGEYQQQQRYRVAGLVKKGSVETIDDDVTRQFVLTDCKFEVIVQYTGILPDLFREGQAIIANGNLNQDSILIAHQVLAKHDENYVPNEATDAMMNAQANKCDNTDGTVTY